MPDQLDRAKDMEMQQRQSALNNTLAKAKEPKQLIIAGEVYCIDCEESIELARLDAKPEAARCIECQNMHELKDHC